MPREYRVLSRRRETARALRKREPREYFYVEVSIEKRVVFALAAVNVFEDQEVFQSLPDFADWPTFPQIYFNSELVGGGDIIIEMAEQDTLKDAMQEAVEKYNS